MTLKEGTYYKLISGQGDESIVYYYRNPDTEILGFGFNTADGGGFMPVWDLVKTTKVIELELKEVV